MLGVAPPGARAWVSTARTKNRKLPRTLELVEVENTLVAINTNNPNRIAAEAIEQGQIAELQGYATLRREVRYHDNSRIDLLLEDGPDGSDCLVEIKNVHLKRETGLAEFPDSVTARGVKHLEALGAEKARGRRAVMLFIVQRNDCERFSTAPDLDPAYHRAFANARTAGVEAICYDCDITLGGVTLRHALPVAPR